MGQIENLVECWIESNKLPFGYEGVESITKKLQNYIGICDTLPSTDKIKALSFLYDKCDYILNSIASSMNYQLDYDPTEDEIWDFIEEQRKNMDIHDKDLPYWKYYISDENIGDPELFDISMLYDYVFPPMKEQYREKNKDAAEWCDKIQDIQTDIYIKISKEKEKQVFLKEVFGFDNKIVKTTIDECLVNCNVAVIKPKLYHLLKGKKGNSIAAVIFALKEELKYTTEGIATLHRIFETEFDIAGKYKGVTSGFRLIERYKEDKNPNDGSGKKLFEEMETVVAYLK